MSALFLDGDIVHYEVLGRGRPLIFLHGWLGSWRYWVSAMQAACTNFRTYALDFWGFGDSAKNRKYSLLQQVDLVDTFLEQMGIGKVALIGHGMGAMAALGFALRRPQFVDRILVVSYPLEEPSVSPRLKQQSLGELSEWLSSRSTDMEPVLSEVAKTDPHALDVVRRALGAPETDRLWVKTSPACLMVHGALDSLVSVPRLEMLAELPPQSHAVLFENSGHYPMLEESSKFNRLMTDFLTLPSGESPRVLQLKEEWKRRVR